MSDLKYNVFDLETSVKNRGDDAVGKWKANPFFDDNKIVCGGYRAYDRQVGMCAEIDGVAIYDPDTYDASASFTNELTMGVEILVGHNIKFDMLCLYKEFPKVKDWVEKGGKVWCTQLAQYIIEGQAKTYPSLNYTAPLYGGGLKDDRIKAFWDEGVDTEDIPKAMLHEYQADDVLNTEQAFLGQLKKAEELGMMALIESQMEALVATIEMEWNGMYFDRGVAAGEIDRLSIDMEIMEKKVARVMEGCIDKRYITINPYSNDQLSVVLFGGALVYKKDIPSLDSAGNPIKFKTGKRAGEVKTRKVNCVFTSEGLCIPQRFTTALKKEGFYATNDKVLKTINSWSVLTSGDKEFITMLLKLRSLKKDLSTYFIGYGDLCWPDGRIHGSIHHCSTVTGRLSSSAPNLQNMTSSGD